MALTWSNRFSRRSSDLQGSQIRAFFALAEKPEVISFAGGFPGNGFFPRQAISAALERLIRERCSATLQYGPTEGHGELRAYLAARMSGGEKQCPQEEIIITDGSQQGLDLLYRLLVDPGEYVLVEEPAYIGGISAIKSYGGVPLGIPMDKEGPLPEAMAETIERLKLENRPPRLFYTVPNFQNPTGITTSSKRRQAILALAERYNLVIIEDDPYGELSYEEPVPPSYYSLDRSGRVIYIGSFSKTLIPGIRVGWMAGPTPLLKKAVMAKQTSDLCSSSIGQQLVCLLAGEGVLEKHILSLRTIYRHKRDVMIQAMERDFPRDITYNRPGGGFFTWVSFPSTYPRAEVILELALACNVAFIPGAGFFSGEKGSHYARFSFSQPEPVEIRAGINRLAGILETCSGRRTGQETRAVSLPA